MPSQESRIESLERTLAELEALEAIYGCDDDEGTQFTVLSQSALEQARALVENPSSADTLPIPDLELTITCPLDAPIKLQCRLFAGYPEERPAQVTSANSTLLHRSGRDALVEALNESAASLVGSEAVMALVETLKEMAPNHCQKEESAPDNDNNTPISTQPPQLQIISSHHLLDHPPDSYLAKGGTKHKLKGVYKFGTPGLAICVGCTEANVDHFQAALEKKMPQKKFEIVLCRDYDGQTEFSGWEEATMEQLRQLLTPDEFTAILNIQGGGAAAIGSSKGKNGKGKKKK